MTTTQFLSSSAYFSDLLYFVQDELDNIHHKWYGVYTMNRYQIYLDPKTVRIIDDVSQELGLRRSAIIRDVISRVAREYEKALKAARTIPLKKHPIMKMAGIIKGTSGKSIAENVDEIYFQD